MSSRNSLSVNNVNVITGYGATPYIAFKSIHSGKAGGMWEKMFHYLAFNRQEFLQHYHKRSNVESTFSMIKAKFRDHVRSRTDVAMTNEVLCKVLCHNICCLIQSMYELTIEPTSWAQSHETTAALQASLDETSESCGQGRTRTNGRLFPGHSQ
jgi:hypothetical protein